MSGGTDNQGNEFVVDKMMTTKFPLCVVLMEISAQLRAKNTNLGLRWRRRDANTEADDLTNSKFEAFDPQRRVVVDLQETRFIVLRELMSKGEEMCREVSAERAELKAAPEKRVVLKNRRYSLKTTQPW
jgi:hypothetical protein